MAIKGSKQKRFSPETKIRIAKRLADNEISLNLAAKEIGTDRHTIADWRDRYMEHGEAYFYEEHRGKGNHRGNPYAALHTSKHLTEEERLRLENLKLRIENERLKKGYIVKGVGANKEYAISLDANTKSSKN